MTLELIVFVASILFGILLYWRESNGNGFYRFINKLVNSKDLQMKSSDKKGFIFQQSFLLRLVYITALFLILLLVLKFLIPINYTTISIFASMVVGTVIGTYVANFVIKSGDVIEEKSDSLEDMVHDTIEKGKDFIEDVTKKGEDIVDDIKDDAKELKEDVKELKEDVKDTIKETEKSARDRLKDKGLL